MRLPTPAEIEKSYATLLDDTKYARETSGVPGVAIAVTYRGADGSFTQRMEGFDPGNISADTVFQLASLSKPISSTIAAAQVARGAQDDIHGKKARVTWSSRLIDLDPTYPLARPEVTLESLFAHRSGLPDHAGDLLEDTGFDRHPVLDKLRLLPLLPPTATSPQYAAPYAYTNFGLTAGACAAAHAEGRTWEDLARAELIKLGMTSTTVTEADRRKQFETVVLHQRDPAPLAGEEPFPANATWRTSHREPDPQAPAGGVASTARDLAKWMTVHLSAYTPGHDDPLSVALRYTHQPYAGGGYGLGWNTSKRKLDGRVRLSHSGAFSLGASTAVSLIPDPGVGITIITNGQPLGVPEALIHAFLVRLDLIESNLGGLETKGMPFPQLLDAFGAKTQADLYPPPELPATGHTVRGPGRPLTAYTGTYTHPYYGDLVVRVNEAGALALKVGTVESTLAEWDFDTFTYVPPGENGGTRSAVTFHESGGAIVALGVMHLFEPYELGHAPPEDTADTWSGTYTVDTRLEAPGDCVIRTFEFEGHRVERAGLPPVESADVRLLVYRRVGGVLECVEEGPVIRAALGPNAGYAGDIPMNAGDLVGFHQPGRGTIALHRDERGNDRGHGDLSGPVQFTAGDAGSPNALAYSHARRYHLGVQLAWGLRGPGLAKRR